MFFFWKLKYDNGDTRSRNASTDANMWEFSISIQKSLRKHQTKRDFPIFSFNLPWCSSIWSHAVPLRDMLLFSIMTLSNATVLQKLIELHCSWSRNKSMCWNSQYSKLDQNAIIKYTIMRFCSQRQLCKSFASFLGS